MPTGNFDWKTLYWCQTTRFWILILDTRDQPVFVTGADSTFWRTLFQLLLAVERKKWREAGAWIVYDLGMSAEQLGHLKRRFKWAEFRLLDLVNLPAHYAPHTGSFAWKPYILWEVVKTSTGPVIWMDSATLPKTSPGAILDWINEHGLFLLRGQAPLQERCDPQVLKHLDIPVWTWGTRECIAGFVGIDASNSKSRSIAEEWAYLAENAALLLPDNPSISRHMNDQAVLNALVLPRLCTGELVIPELDADISSPRPAKYLSTRNKVASHLPLWLDPALRAWFSTSKAIDQWAHRIDRWHGRNKILPRILHEYYDIYVQKNGHSETIKSPIGHYFADPFLLDHDGEIWLFYEDYNYVRRRGTIGALPLSNPDAHREVLDPGCHASYPFLFRHKGRLFMLPETCANRVLDLYECTEFPNTWERRTRILEDVDVADSIIFEHENRWWLITSMESPNAKGMYRYLAIFYSDDPIDGPWSAHPVNVQGREIGAPKGTGRNAGTLVTYKNALLRPVQKSTNYYGEGMEYRRIITLTPTEFTEEPFQSPPHLKQIIDAKGVHHLSQSGDLLAWDKRLRH